jgi:uncharacterized protein YutE (UPF0331/DUF86 family)
MSGGGGDKAPRRVDLRRRQKKIVDELANLPREHEALEYAMTAFGADFDLKALKAAMRADADIALYSNVQALERAVTRVQNILADLAVSGAKLAGLELPEARAGEAERSFEALKQSGVISAALCKRLRKAQKTRNRIEHDYDKVTAAQMREVAMEVRDLSREFLRPFRDWIAPAL